MNRSSRRKHVRKIANAIVKGNVEARERGLRKKQVGFGLIVTSHMGAVIFWRWTWTMWDRRAA